MTERPEFRECAALERALGLLEEDVLFPQAPDLAGAFRLHLEQGARSRIIPLRHVRAWKRWQLAALAAILVVALAISIPGARSTLAGWLEFAGIRIEIGGDDGPPEQTPTSIGGNLFLGRQVSLAEARRSSPLEVLIPSSPLVATQPTVYIDHRDGTPIVSVVYPAGATLPEIGDTGVGLLLMRFDPAGDTELYTKRSTGTRSPVLATVNGSFAAWIEDGSIAVPPASNRAGSERPSAHVLIWERDGITFRMESNLSLDDATAIAESLEPITPPVTAGP